MRSFYNANIKFMSRNTCFVFYINHLNVKCSCRLTIKQTSIIEELKYKSVIVSLLSSLYFSIYMYVIFCEVGNLPL